MIGREIAAIAALVTGLVAPDPFLILSRATDVEARCLRCDDRELERAAGAAPARRSDGGGTATGPLVAE
jgi:hypothetical protein